MTLLTVMDLSVSFPPGGQAVRGVSFSVGRGEIVGLVGESGSGKSLTCLSVAGLAGRRALVQGKVFWYGEDVLPQSETQLTRLRGREIGMIFQDPVAALNPLRTVEAHFAEVLPRKTRRSTAVDLLSAVGIREPERRLRQHPCELSGGIAQRVGIALALALEPRLLLADEPTTALDATIQAQVLGLLAALRETRGLSILLVSHDLTMVADVCDRILVMYAGRIVEAASAEQIVTAPAHPYTRSLLDARPERAEPGTLLPVLEGAGRAEAPNGGCAFAPRCPRREALCGETQPLLDLHVGAACHRPLREGAPR